MRLYLKNRGGLGPRWLRWLRWWWLFPILWEQRLATGSFGGYVGWWGPFRFWNFTTHSGERRKGWCYGR